MSKKILVVCGTGVATSTVVVRKVKDFCQSEGFTATVDQGKVSDLVSGSTNADFIVATTQIPSSVTVPVIQAVPLLTGIGAERVYDEIRAQFS